MSEFLHQRKFLRSGQLVVLDCDTQCNFMILSDANFAAYRSGCGYEYHGGFFEMFPAKIAVPMTGSWNVVVDLGGGRAAIRYAIRYL